MYYGVRYDAFACYRTYSHGRGTYYFTWPIVYLLFNLPHPIPFILGVGSDGSTHLPITLYLRCHHSTLPLPVAYLSTLPYISPNGTLCVLRTDATVPTWDSAVSYVGSR